MHCNFRKPVLLSIAAFQGVQARGTETKAFHKQMQTLRDAQISVVDDLKIALYRDDRQIGQPLNVPSLWLSDAQVLLVRDLARTDIGQISEALASLLDREDLEVAIKLVLGKATSEPGHEDVIRALSQIKITEAHYREVYEHWRGDVRQIVERLTPLVSILRSNEDVGALIELTTDDQLLQYIGPVVSGQNQNKFNCLEAGSGSIS